MKVRAVADAAGPEISILIVAYGSRGCIGACLDAVVAGGAEVRHEILLVDNGTDGSAALVAARFPQVRILPSQGNIGFARAVNMLARHARGRAVLLLNPDMVVEAGAIDSLVRASRGDAGTAAWGGVTVDAAGTADTGNMIAAPTLAGLARAVVGGGTPARGTGDDPAVLSGGFVLIDAQAWQEAGGFDEDYFLYSEEVDLFHRLRRKGWTLRRVEGARARHDIGHGNSLDPRRLLFMAAGKAEFLRKHRSAAARWTGVGLIWLAAWVRLAAGSVAGHGNAHWRALARGYRRVALAPGLWMHGYDPDRGLARQWELGQGPRR